MQRPPADADPPHRRLARRPPPRAARSRRRDGGRSRGGRPDRDRARGGPRARRRRRLRPSDPSGRRARARAGRAPTPRGGAARRRGGRQSRLPRAVRRARAAGAGPGPRRPSGRVDPAARPGRRPRARTSSACPRSSAVCPFLREGRVVDFMRDAGEWYGQYAERIAALCAAFDAALVARAGTGSRPAARRPLHGGRREGRAAPSGAARRRARTSHRRRRSLPGPQYVALGHIHAPQAVPGSPVPGQYAGSLLPLDFGEAGEAKRVVIVDAEPGRLATVTSMPLVSGRPLVRAEGTWDEIDARDR